MNSIKVEVEVEVNPFDYLSEESSCFICLQPVSSAFDVDKLNSLNFFFNYLKIAKVESSICEKCGGNLARFWRLGGILEKVKLEMDYLLGLVQDGISNSEDDAKMQSVGFNSVRDAVKKRCRESICNPKVEILVERTDVSKVIKSKLQPPSRPENPPPNTVDDFLQDLFSSPVEGPSTPPIPEMNTRVTSLEDVVASIVNGTGTIGASKSNLGTKRPGSHAKNSRCPKCSKMFYSKGELRRHMDSHLIKPFKCEVCDMSFAEVARLNYHKTIYKHNSEVASSKKAPENPSKKAPEKSRKAPRKKKLVKRREEDLHSVKDYLCDICEKTFKLSAQLKAHVAAVHENKRHHCQAPGCEKSYRYSRQADLMTHYRLVHPDFVIPSEPNQVLESEEMSEDESDVQDEFILP